MAESISDFSQLNKVGDLDSAPVYPQWVSYESILNGKILFADSCIGLKDIIYSVVKNTKSMLEAV